MCVVQKVSIISDYAGRFQSETSTIGDDTLQ